MKETCDRCGKTPVIKYKLEGVTGKIDVAILEELWFCGNCLGRSVRMDEVNK